VLAPLKYLMRMLVYLSLLILVGCQSRPAGYQVESSKNIESWFLQGKVFLISPDERFSASIIWDKQEEISHIKLLSPLGTTLLTLDVTPTMSTLHMDDRVYYDTDAEKLLWKTTSWLIPLKRMQQWVKGQSTVHDQVVTRDKQGRLRYLRAQYAKRVWHIRFKSWQNRFGADIPEQITAQHEKIKFKINIYDWIPQ